MGQYITGLKAGKYTLPGAFSTTVLMKALSEKEMIALYKAYAEHRETRRSRFRAPTEEQQRMAEEFRKAGTAKEVAVKYKISQDAVRYAVRVVALHKYMQQ